MTVRSCVHDRFGAEVAAAARPVLNDELLAKPLRKPMTEQACEDIGPAASRNVDDNAHGPGRIGLRPSEGRCSRQRGSAYCEMQQLTA